MQKISPLTRVKDHILNNLLDYLFAGVVTIPICAGIGAYVYSKKIEQSMISRFEARIDINSDYVISKEELGEAYKSLGRRFNESNPRELTFSEMERYLQMTEVEKER